MAAATSPFPTWPPPNGGYPINAPELGPVLNPYRYGTVVQAASISIANPAPPNFATVFPKKYTDILIGQNQAAPTRWPAWPANSVTTLPSKADSATSRIP